MNNYELSWINECHAKLLEGLKLGSEANPSVRLIFKVLKLGVFFLSLKTGCE